jgi:hypothetical protein
VSKQCIMSNFTELTFFCRSFFPWKEQ